MSIHSFRCIFSFQRPEGVSALHFFNLSPFEIFVNEIFQLFFV